MSRLLFGLLIICRFLFISAGRQTPCYQADLEYALACPKGPPASTGDSLADAIQDLLVDDVIFAYSPSWNLSEWKKNSGDILGRADVIEDKHMRLVVAWLGGFYGKTHTDAEVALQVPYFDKIARGDFLKATNLKAVKNEFCRYWGFLLPFIDSKQLEDLREECQKQIILGYSKVPEYDMHKLGGEVGKSFSPKTYFKALSLFNTPDLTVYSLSLVRRILEYQKFILCKELTWEHLEHLANYPSYSELIASECIRNLPELLWKTPLTAKQSKLVRKLPSMLFYTLSASIELHSSWLENATRAQVSLYQGDSTIRPASKCLNFALTAIPQASLDGVRPDCFLGYLRGLRSRRQRLELSLTELDDRWVDLPDNIFARFTINADKNAWVLDALDDTQWPLMTDRQLETLLKVPLFCSKAPPSLFEAHPSLQISGECFGRLKQSSQSAALQYLYRVPEDMLLHVDGKQIRSWVVSRSNQQYKGLLALEVIGNDIEEGYSAGLSREVDAIFAHLGQGKNGGTHCRGTIESLVDLAKIGIHVRKRIDSKCFNQFHVADQDEISQTPELFQHQSLEQLILKFGRGFSHLNPEQFSQIASADGNFCQNAQPDLLFQMDEKLINQIGADCFSRLPRKDKITNDVLEKLSDVIFEEMTADGAEKLNLDRLSTAKFIKISSKLESKTFAGSWNESYIRRLSVDRISSMPAKMFSQITVSAYPGFSADQIRAIRPESMTRMTRDQVSQLCCLNVLTKQQKQLIGKDYRGTSQDPLPLPTQTHSKGSLDVQKPKGTSFWSPIRNNHKH